MTNSEITPTTKADIREFFPRATDWRIKAITVRIDGEIKGIGGYAILPNGTRLAFLEASEEACKKYPMTLSRATKKFFSGLNVSRMNATCDEARKAAPRWLERLGFKHMGNFNGEDLWQWRH